MLLRYFIEPKFKWSQKIDQLYSSCDNRNHLELIINKTISEEQGSNKRISKDQENKNLFLTNFIIFKKLLKFKIAINDFNNKYILLIISPKIRIDC
jgi:hypothetical protein